jgi:hypothetical protein
MNSPPPVYRCVLCGQSKPLRSHWLGLAVFKGAAATSTADEHQTLRGLCLRAVSEMGRPFLLPICQLSITLTAAKRG